MYKIELDVKKKTFYQFDQLENDLFEVQHAKKSVTFDMPIQVGYWVLQLAKVRMLEFYYDFLHTYIEVERSDFEYIEMDTDSAYIGISAETLSELIKPEMKNKYNIIHNS